MLASLLRLQLPTPSQALDYGLNLTSKKENVNNQISIHDKLGNYKKQVDLQNDNRIEKHSEPDRIC